jgi:hypothetical protein
MALIKNTSESLFSVQTTDVVMAFWEVVDLAYSKRDYAENNKYA